MEGDEGVLDDEPVDGGASAEEAGQGKHNGVAEKEDAESFSSLLWQLSYEAVRESLEARCAIVSCSSVRTIDARTVASDGRIGRDGELADILPRVRRTSTQLPSS